MVKTKESRWGLVKGCQLEERNFLSETRRWEKGQAHLLLWRVRAQAPELDFLDENAPFFIYQLSDLV